MLLPILQILINPLTGAHTEPSFFRRVDSTVLHIQKKTPTRLCGCFLLVRHIATFWNQFEESLFIVDAKLTKLGFVYINGQVAIIEPDAEVSRV